MDGASLAGRPVVHPGSPRVRVGDPVSSHEAADATHGCVGASQAAVREVLAGVMFPLTDAEIVRLVNRERVRFSESRIRTARHELVEDGGGGRGWVGAARRGADPLHNLGTRMSEALFGLDEFEETRVGWVPLGWHRTLCGLCGTKCSMNQGGTDVGMVCDACANVDRCRLVCCDPVAERRPAKVGHEQWECAHCSCGWWAFETYWHDEGEYRQYTAEEIADMLADHAVPRHVTHWGKSHPVERHDALAAAQEKRRSAYLAKAVGA